MGLEQRLRRASEYLVQTGILWRNRSLTPRFVRRPNTRNEIQTIVCLMLLHSMPRGDAMSLAQLNQIRAGTRPLRALARSQEAKREARRSSATCCASVEAGVA